MTMISRILAAAIFATAAFATLGHATAARAAAPTATYNIDDPGNSPYRHTTQRTTPCPGIECILEFPAPPPGWRLVVTHVSCDAATGAAPTTVVAASLTSIVGTNEGDISDYLPVTLQGTKGSISLYNANAQTAMVYQPGERPAVVFFAGTFSGKLNIGIAACTVLGYAAKIQ
jgi:hypothetical protein